MSKATVFANDMSYAAKAYDGKSSLQLVDICHSPGKGIPKPYKNTAYASQLANASVSVFISHLPVAQKDKSYFANSTGNEKATDKFGMGIITHVITGGAHFVNWSPDVFVEGYNACRHLDSMTHNHSNPTNTGYWVYKDSRRRRKPCENDKKAVDKKCQANKDRKNFKKGKRRNTKAEKDKTWKDAHCDGLRISPIKGNLEDLKREMKHSITSYEDLFSKSIGVVEEIVKGKIKDFAIKQGLKLAAKAAVGAFIPIAGWVFAAGSAAMSAADMAVFAEDMKDVIKDFKELQKGFKELLTGDTGKIIDKLKSNGSDVSPQELADLMSAWAKLNPCIRAKKCQLQPYSPGNTEALSVADKNAGFMTNASRQGNGCCSGQTAHHVIPNSWMMAFRENCPKYSPAAGLSICVEGTSHSYGGSHAAIHGSLDTAMKKKGLLRLKDDATKTKRALLQETIKFDKATELAAESVVRTFPESRCSKRCLVNQLEDYYEGLCDSTSGDMPLKDHKGNAPYDDTSTGNNTGVS